MNELKANKATDEKDSVVIGDARLMSLFEPEHIGKRKTQGEVMQSFKTGVQKSPIMHGSGV